LLQSLLRLSFSAPLKSCLVTKRVPGEFFRSLASRTFEAASGVPPGVTETKDTNHADPGFRQRVDAIAMILIPDP
jgi:hypothetical protein